jgi:outer membrane protein assembly factor BamA
VARRGREVTAPCALLLRVVSFCAAVLAVGTADAQPHTAATPPAPPQQVLADVRIHGNYATPDAEVLSLAGVAIGQALEAGAAERIAARLRTSGRFDAVEVRTRYRSLTSTDAVVLVVLVHEHPTPMKGPLPTRIPQMLAGRLLVLPILSWADGYGFTYGARATFADVAGRRGRLSVPLSWGGTKRAAVELDTSFRSPVVHRLEMGAGLASRENPFYRIDDTRREAWLRVERRLAKNLRAGIGAEWSDVGFGEIDDRVTSIGARVTYDGRTNPVFPRNALFGSASLEVLDFAAMPTAARYRLDGRSYIGLVGQSVASVRVLYDAADRTLPPYEQALLGGSDTLRGFRTGSFAGDRLLTSSVELRVPIDSPLDVGQSGLKLFADTGAVTMVDEPWRRARFHQGIGAGWFLINPLFQLNLDVAYGIDNRWRLHVVSGFQF